MPGPGIPSLLLGRALPLARRVARLLESSGTVHRCQVAGSVRRMQEAVANVNFVASSAHCSRTISTFCALSPVRRVMDRRSDSATVLLSGSIPADLRVTQEEQYGLLLRHRTGSRAHNRHLEERGVPFPETAESEEVVYRELGLEFIEPELRENRGEVEAARQGSLPRLVGYHQVRGDLHVHSSWGDGKSTLQTLAGAARDRGYEYLAITDHTRSSNTPRGLTPEEIRAQMREIEHLNRRVDGTTLLCGIEANIDLDGQIDLDPNLARDLDLVIASTHSGFRLTSEENTRRLVAALHQEGVRILGHPTGRVIGRRMGVPLDFPRLLEEAKALHVALEINAHPLRLDLPDLLARQAAHHGVVCSLGSDAHRVESLPQLILGTGQARRAWLEPGDLINTRSLSDLFRSFPG